MVAWVLRSPFSHKKIKHNNNAKIWSLLCAFVQNVWFLVVNSLGEPPVTPKPSSWLAQALCTLNEANSRPIPPIRHLFPPVRHLPLHRCLVSQVDRHATLKSHFAHAYVDINRFFHFSPLFTGHIKIIIYIVISIIIYDYTILLSICLL